MTEHFTEATESVTKWCDTCLRVTEHAVSGKRLGRCKEHAAGDPASGMSKKQIAARERRAREQKEKERNPPLFEDKS